MVEQLACELSPLVYSEFYRLLAAERSFQDALAERIFEAGLDDDWLEHAADAYEAKWVEYIRVLSQACSEMTGSIARVATPPEPVRLPSDHAVLASWLIAGLRPLEMDGLDSKLGTAISTRMQQDVPQLLSPKPLAFCPVILGWTFGMLVDGQLDSQLPAIPAQPVADPNIAAAYSGLVSHIAHLGPVEEPWPEILGTSTLIRGAGLAERLRPDAGGPRKAIEQLMIETKRAVPDSLYRQLNLHWRTFVNHRDAIVHVLPKTELAFIDAMETADTWEKIRPTVRGMTQFVFQQVATELAEPRIVSPKYWSTLRYDLEVYPF